MISKILINYLDLDPEWANNESKPQENMSYPLRLNKNPDTTPTMIRISLQKCFLSPIDIVNRCTAHHAYFCGTWHKLVRSSSKLLNTNSKWLAI